MIDKDVLWKLRDHIGAWRTRGRPSSIQPSARVLGWIVQSFRAQWPAVDHPTGSSIGYKNDWDATEFLNRMIALVGDDVGDEAQEVMAFLSSTNDGYADYVRTVAAEQRRKVVEARYRPPSLGAVAAAISGGAPTSATDLQAFMLEELEVAQARLKGDRLDWYKGFFKAGGAHKDEEACRDELLKMLDGNVRDVELRPESHLADDKRVDIECSVSTTVMVPIEIKGQWHKALWTAADDQLDKLYSNDWRADRRGIYLVLWFGPAVALAKPPAGIAVPTKPEALQEALVASSKQAKTGLVDIVVLDLTRP